MITGFRAYFADGTILTSKTVNWKKLPADGMLGLVVFTDDGSKKRITGGDYYYLDPVNGKYGMDKLDFASSTLRYPSTYLIRGQWTDDAAMKAMEARMKSDVAP